MSVCSELRLSNRTVSTKTRESGECSRGQHLPVLYEPHLGVKGIRWQEKKLISPEDSRSSEMLYSLALKTPLLFMPPTVAKRPGRLTGATEGDPQGAAQNQASTSMRESDTMVYQGSLVISKYPASSALMSQDLADSKNSALDSKRCRAC